ncbi:MAG: hypothetical protein RLY67_740 [Pseudomonadota bacterium]
MILPLENLLFHGSSIQNVERILESDRLLAQSRLPSELARQVSPRFIARFPDCRVASLSRSLSVARSHSSGIGRIQGAVLALDAEALKRRLGARLIPCNDLFLESGQSRSAINECEEAALGGVRPIRSLIRYVILFKLGQRSVHDLLADFSNIARHSGLVVVQDRRRSDWDHSSQRAFERFIHLGSLRKQLATSALLRHKSFRHATKRLSLLKQLAANEPARWSRRYPEPIDVRTLRGDGSWTWRPAV